MTLIFRKQEGETWKEAMLRHARPYGLEEDVLETYTRLITEDGLSGDQAARDALYEWDLLEPGAAMQPDPDVFVDDTFGRWSASKVNEMFELMRRWRGIMNLSGFTNAANAGFLTQHGIRNIDDLNRLKEKMDALLDSGAAEGDSAPMGEGDSSGDS